MARHGDGADGGNAGDYGKPGRGDCGEPGSGDGRPVTIIVDGANVVGSRPDGWWRDRAGAAVRLHDSLAGLAARGPASIVLVLEGAAKAAVPRIAARAGGQPGAGGETGTGGQPGAGDQAGAHGGAGPGRAAGTVRVVAAPGSGDDEIVRLAGSLPGRRIVVTADRELRQRSVAAGAEVAGPSWLRDQAGAEPR